MTAGRVVWDRHLQRSFNFLLGTRWDAAFPVGAGGNPGPDILVFVCLDFRVLALPYSYRQRLRFL